MDESIFKTQVEEKNNLTIRQHPYKAADLKLRNDSLGLHFK